MHAETGRTNVNEAIGADEDNIQRFRKRGGNMIICIAAAAPVANRSGCSRPW